MIPDDDLLIKIPKKLEKDIIEGLSVPSPYPAANIKMRGKITDYEWTKEYQNDPQGEEE